MLQFNICSCVGYQQSSSVSSNCSANKSISTDSSVNYWNMLSQFSLKYRVKIFRSTDSWMPEKKVREWDAGYDWCMVFICFWHQRFRSSLIDFDVNEFNHDGFILPVKQYALVKAAKTPTSFEFSNEQRVAMVKWSVVKILCILCVINEVKESPTRLDTNRKLRKLVVDSERATVHVSN